MRLSFHKTFRLSMDDLFACANKSVHADVVATSAIVENMFAMTVCIDACLPLIVVGPAGVSKTLAFTMTMSNFSKRDTKPFERKLVKQLYVFFYY